VKNTVPYTRLAVLGLLVGLCAWTQVPGRRLGQFTRSVVPDRIAGAELRCENGFIAVFDLNDSPRVLVYGRTGLLERAHDLALPDTLRFSPNDVSVSANGLVAVAGSAVSAEGAVASVIFLFQKPGPPTRVIRTNPFDPIRIALSRDGHLWVFGRDPQAEKRREDYPVFQRYTLDGRLTGQFVMRSTFPSRTHPAMHGGRNGGVSCLRAARQGIGAYTAVEREWIELDGGGSLVGRWKPRPPLGASDCSVERVAVTDSGSVYAQLLLGSRRVLCRLDRSGEVWEPIDGTDYELKGPIPVATQLFGVDGDQLVYRGPTRELLWFDEPR